MEQLVIRGLFEREACGDSRMDRKSKVDACARWLMEKRGCSDEVVPYVERLFEPPTCATSFDRASVLDVLCGRRRVDGWSLDDVGVLGVFDASLDHHVVWDRGWAARMLAPKRVVCKVMACDYAAMPSFFDEDGNLVFQGVYMVDGRPLLDSERREIMRGETHG